MDQKPKKNDQSISGYVSSLSPLKNSKNGKRTYFDFKLGTQTKQSRTVCFSPEKRRLIESISSEGSNAGCQLANYKSGESGDIMITNFTSVKKVKLNFEKPEYVPNFVPISDIINEVPLYSVVNVKGTVYSIEDMQRVMKYGKELKLKKAMLKDGTESIPITFFDKLVDQVSENSGYQITNVRVSLFNECRLLKTTELTDIVLDEASKVEITKEEVSQNKPPVVDGTVVSIDLKSMEVRYQCPGCKKDKVPDNGIILCEECEKMTTVECCLNATKAEFTVVESSTNLLHKFKVDFEIFENGFKPFYEDAKTKIQIANNILRKEVEVVYAQDTMDVKEITAKL